MFFPGVTFTKYSFLTLYLHGKIFNFIHWVQHRRKIQSTFVYIFFEYYSPFICKIYEKSCFLHTIIINNRSVLM